MSRIARGGLLVALCLVIVAGMVLTGCGGKKKEAALLQPGVEFTNYVKGATVDFDETTLNAMAAGSQASFMYGIAKAIYPSVWTAYKDTVAQSLFPAPYWRGDGVHTYYTYLTSADQGAVDGTIFATKLSAAEQAIVTNTVESFFALYADETAAAKPMEQNTAWLILYSSIPDSGASAAAWATEATAWVTALNTYAAATYGGKTYAQSTYAERLAAKAAVFNNGAGTINPEYSLWRLMVQTSFRNGNASARWPDIRDARVAAMYPTKTYATLDCVERPTVDGAVWAVLTADQRLKVTNPGDPAHPGQIESLWNLATEQVDGVKPDNQNIYYYTLSQLPAYLTYDNDTAKACQDWLDKVNGKPHDYDSSADFYAELLYNQAQWKGALTYQYFGTDNYSALSAASKALIDQADTGMKNLSIAQRSDVLGSANEIPLTSNIIYQTLYYSVSAAAAAGWETEARAGVNRELATYKWMAYEGFRNGTAVTFYPTQLAEKMTALYPSRTSSSLTSCETLALNAAVWAALGAGEQGYGNGAIAGLWGKVEAEMTDAFAADQTTLSMQLRGTTAAKGFSSETAAANFKTDVEGGMLLRSAFYKWLAKESVKEMASAAVLLRESVGEFYIKITNPNEYDISIDSLKLYFRTTVSASTEPIDAARQVLEGIWVPAKVDDQDGEVILKVLAPTKTYDLLSWLAMGGTNTNTARSMAMEVFDNIQDGSIVWTAEAQIQVSHENDIQNYTYTLTQS